MPKSRRRPDNQQVQDSAGRPFAVAAQGNIEVFLEPTAERHMPSSPKFCDAFRNIRKIKVLGEIEPQHFAKPDGHEGIAAEIKVNLQGECEDTQPGKGHRDAIVSQRTDVVPEHTDIIGKQDLASKA